MFLPVFPQVWNSSWVHWFASRNVISKRNKTKLKHKRILLSLTDHKALPWEVVTFTSSTSASSKNPSQRVWRHRNKSYQNSDRWMSVDLKEVLKESKEPCPVPSEHMNTCCKPSLYWQNKQPLRVNYNHYGYLDDLDERSAIMCLYS